MTGVVPGPVGAPTWSNAWADALAELEMSVADAEELLLAARRTGALDPAAAVAAATGWTPPSGLGVLPAPLVDRARALVGRQAEVAQQLAEAASHSRRQLRAAHALRATPEAGPVYLDAAG